MRVLCRGMEDGEVEGELIAGTFLNADTGEFDLEETFMIRRDDGKVFEVHGWMVDFTIMTNRPAFAM